MLPGCCCRESKLPTGSEIWCCGVATWSIGSLSGTTGRGFETGLGWPRTGFDWDRTGLGWLRTGWTGFLGNSEGSFRVGNFEDGFVGLGLGLVLVDCFLNECSWLMGNDVCGRLNGLGWTSGG